MKILWVCSMPLPEIAEHIGLPSMSICGWLTGFANGLKFHNNIELHIAFKSTGKKQYSGEVDGIHYYSFRVKKLIPFLNIGNQYKTSQMARTDILNIIHNVKPDILHIFGTETAYSNDFASLFDKKDKILVHIQGLVSVCASHYTASLGVKALKKFVISNIIRGNILKQQKRFAKLGEIEKDTFNIAHHATGRTTWDKTCIKAINPNINYHFCNEILRDSFYDGIRWNINKCKRNSIFMSQGSYPIKGLHFMLEALPAIISEFPDTMLYVAGNNQTRNDTLYHKLRISSYGLYLRELIKKYNLEKHVIFTGMLNEQEMKRKYLDSHVFVMPSSIENSPNSVGEAMILGVPTIASYVGGCPDMITHCKDGFLYSYDESYMISQYVCEVFRNDNLSKTLSDNAIETAGKIFDRKVNTDTLIDIYERILFWEV